MNTNKNKNKKILPGKKDFAEENHGWCYDNGG
jgi:hypothetical protein